MSLINQMLRDLEVRRAAERRQQGVGLLSGMSSSIATPGHHPWLRWLFAAVILLLLVLVAYLAWQRYAPRATTEAALPAPVISATAPAQAPPATTPAPTKPAAGDSTPPESVAAPPSVPANAAPRAAKPAAAVTSKTPAHAEISDAATAAEPVLIEKHPRPLSMAQQSEQAYQRSLDFLRAGKPHEAETALREALRLDNEHLLARETLAAMLINAGRVVEAGEVLEAGRRFFSRNPTLALLMARLLVEQGNLDAAVTTLEHNLHGAAGRADYLAFLAALYQRAKRYNDSIASYKQALALEPQQGSWWAGLAISLENNGQRTDALLAYRQAAGQSLPTQLASYVQGRLNALSSE